MAFLVMVAEAVAFPFEDLDKTTSLQANTAFTRAFQSV